MPDLSKRFDLAVIGMEISGPGISDLESFGFQTFRGLKISFPAYQKEFHTDDLKRMITDIIQKAGMNFKFSGCCDVSNRYA